MDCQAACDESRKTAEDAGCGSEYDEALSACAGEAECGETSRSQECAEASTKLVACAFESVES